MEFATEMDEVEEFLRTNKYSVHVGNDKVKKANFRRKCRAFVIQNECLKFVHKPNRKDMTEVRFLWVIKDRQYQFDIVLASHRGAGDSRMLSSRKLMQTLSKLRQNSKLILRRGGTNKRILSWVHDKVLRYNLRRADRKGGKQTDPWAGPYKVAQVCEKGLYCLINASTKVTLKTKVNGCNLKPFLEYIPEAPSVTPSPDVQIVGVKQEEISYKFSPLTVAIQRTICNNSGGRLVFKKKSGLSGKINKTFKNTSEPHTVKDIEGDGNCLFRALSFTISGEEDQHAVVRSLIRDFIACTENIQAESMCNDKVWGTTREILAAANMFNVNVCVWAKYGPKLTWHIHRPNGEEIVEESVYCT
ncbi:hypothetical protein Pmani_028422 [Petrolisthes manimaculis]|uniref:OTU domain-containing protein n=1 Tax=Petrolisthes manimaculis TaxID=1843537 RepID=A0AAE1NZJ0_9EUCA|nr:hypothetical protein Pmani_028422 [Petrolisthes manimaculis]